MEKQGLIDGRKWVLAVGGVKRWLDTGEKVHECWEDRCARVAKFGKCLDHGMVVSAKAEPGVGVALEHVFVELEFRNMSDAVDYFTGRGTLMERKADV